MDCDRFLNSVDASRLAATLHRLSRHDISGWALTGGIAIELHIQRFGGEACLRPLHDVDFVADSFEQIPASLGDKLRDELLMRHVHPHDPPGKTMLQGVDPETSVRVDVFRAYGFEMDRVSTIEVAGVALRMVSLRDIVARHARLNWDLMEGKQVAPKYARDFLRLLEFVAVDQMEDIWQEHRKPQSPENFAATIQQLRRVIGLRSDLLVGPTYSTDPDEVCPRCRKTDAFRLADARQIMLHLGYC
jgi:hypothetical protein